MKYGRTFNFSAGPAMYYLQEVLKHKGEDIKGKTIACAGFGNVTWGICKKALHLGAKVVTLSGPDGYIYDPDGVSSSQEKVDYLLTMSACSVSTNRRSARRCWNTAAARAGASSGFRRASP